MQHFVLYCALALCTATQPGKPAAPPKFIYATKNEVKQQLAAAKRRLDANATDVRAKHAVAKILRALGDVDGDATARNVGFENATQAWALAASVDVEGAVHYALRRGDHAEAQRLIGERLREVPDCQIALELRALERRAFGDNEAAARFYDEAAAVAHGAARNPALLRSALGRAAAGDFDGAERVFVDLCGDDAGAEVWREYAFFLDERRNDRERAIAALKRAVKLDPSEGQARAQLAKWGALDDETAKTEKLDDAYVGGLFDQFAASFDETLVEKLGYRGHLQCAEVLKTSLANVELSANLNCVDLGAGTGLCGAPLRRVLSPKTPHITAVDLSTRMLELCAKRGDHDAVVEGEAVAHLKRLPDTSVDVIVAADVLAYIGDCAELFGEAHRVLRTNGRLVFTLEEGDAGFGLGPGGRFVHSEAYLYDAAAVAGLRVVALDRGPMRSQGGAPVVALIAALGPVS